MSWPKVKLRELVTLTGGHAFKSGDFEASGIPLIRIGTANSGTFKTSDFVFLPQEYKSKYSKYLVRPKDLLITLTGTVGKGDYGNVCEATDGYESYLLNQRVAKININSRDLSKRYLYLFLATPEVKKNLTSLSRGVRQANIKNEDILNLEIPLPPLDEQKRIAAILDKANAIRRKRQQAIQLADDFLRSVFLDMFGDPITNPKGGEVKSWKDVLSIVNGKNQKAVLSKIGAYPIMGSGGEMGRASDYLTPENSVIIGRKGNINKPILVKENFWNVDTAFGLVPEPSILSFNYLYWFCKFFDFERLNKAVTIPSLTKVDLLQISIPLPDISKQIRFDKIVNKIELIISKNIHSSQSANDIFNSLSQQAFAGEL